MSNTVLSLILDLSILACLGGTIYYAFRLTNALSNFRDHRKDLQGLITDLTENIDRAVAATEVLKSTSASTGQELQNAVNDAKTMKDELQLLNETAESLARRLADGRSSKPATRDDLEGLFSGGGAHEDDDLSFAIQDREFDDMDDDDMSWDDVSDGDEDLGGFQSKAERDLYQALQSNKKKRSAG